MVYGKDLFIGLFNNLALLIVFIAIYGYLYNTLRTRGWVRRQLINGLIFTVFVFGCMQVRIPVSEGVIVDQRNAIVILSGVYGGPLAAIISACFAAAYRIHLGGIGIYGGVLGVTLSMLTGIVVYRYRDRIDSIWKGACVSLAATVFILPGFLPIRNLEHGWNLLKAMAVPYGTAVFLGIFLGGLLLYNEEKRWRTQ
ncbi:MAG TPA: LytS/YhcK type 5TM receptor domain-containing protein, partial [Spirochaetota bacterium]|nr:LytS/YhcK type 5TM receptor domain-containing protein [Spirochaetota bacterium]